MLEKLQKLWEGNMMLTTDMLEKRIKEPIEKILEHILFDIAMDYAIQNRVPGKDYRRVLFEKELELYSMFGEDFRKRKRQEIDELLKKNPYCDTL